LEELLPSEKDLIEPALQEIVQTADNWTNPSGRGYFEMPLDRNFILLRQFGQYQVFERANSARLSGRPRKT
jgi:hypothetical protein